VKIPANRITDNELAKWKLKNEQRRDIIQKSPISDKNNKEQQQDDDLMGPYNFRQLLRKTNIAPTESLKIRKGLLSCKARIPIDHWAYQPSSDKVNPPKHVVVQCLQPSLKGSQHPRT
jgi:hypothetical protein